jgi:transposase
MSTVTIAVDLAKNVFEVAVAGRAGTIRERKRLSRPQFEHFWVSRASCRVIMEACSSAHFWARFLIARGYDVVLLPPHYVKPYRRRNKTDRADCEAILEAQRCAGIRPVAVKSEDQQALVALHRVRSQWLQSRTARINGMRGLLREFGVTVPAGAKRFMDDLPRLLSEARDRLPERVRRAVNALWEEVRDLEARVEGIENELEGGGAPGTGHSGTAPDPRYRRAHRDRALCHCCQHPRLQQRSPARLLAWAHPAGVLLRLAAPARPHQQAGRSLRADAAHSRRPRRAQRRPTCPRCGQAAHATPGLGTPPRQPGSLQQGGRGAGQQARPNRVGSLEARTNL